MGRYNASPSNYQYAMVYQGVLYRLESTLLQIEFRLVSDGTYRTLIQSPIALTSSSTMGTALPIRMVVF